MSTTHPMPSSEIRAYAPLRALADRLGGRMWHEREGHLHGAWVVELDGVQRAFRSDGDGYPELDRLFIPRIPEPRHTLDYTDELIEDAEEQFRAMVR